MDERTEQRDGIAPSDDTNAMTGATGTDAGSDATAEDAQPTADESLPPMLRAMRRRLPHLAPWVGAVLALILVGMLAMLFADTRTTDAAVRPTPVKHHSSKCKYKTRTLLLSILCESTIINLRFWC